MWGDEFPQFYDTHAQDSRVLRCNSKANAVCARYGTGGGTHQSYWMADKGGHLARWRKIHKAYTLHSSDHKDPPVVLTKK